MSASGKAYIGGGRCQKKDHKEKENEKLKLREKKIKHLNNWKNLMLWKNRYHNMFWNNVYLSCKYFIPPALIGSCGSVAIPNCIFKIIGVGSTGALVAGAPLYYYLPACNKMTCVFIVIIALVI